MKTFRVVRKAMYRHQDKTIIRAESVEQAMDLIDDDDSIMWSDWEPEMEDCYEVQSIDEVPEAQAEEIATKHAQSVEAQREYRVALNVFHKLRSCPTRYNDVEVEEFIRCAGPNFQNGDLSDALWHLESAATELRRRGVKDNGTRREKPSTQTGDSN